VIARFCGPSPGLGSTAISDSRPSPPTLYAAMLSCPRFVPYRNRLSGETFTSAQWLVPLTSSARVETFCFFGRVPGPAP
jgi:hypothetical protein